MARKDRGALKYLNFGISFGLTLAITVYLLYLGGNWLDNKLGTSPLFVMLGILLAVATVFKQLLSEVKSLNGEREKGLPKINDQDKGKN